MAYYNNEEVAEILSKIDIVDEMSETVQLNKKGRNYFGCCPFHNEKTASMSVSSEKQIFKCFGCGESGNVLGFVMKKYNYEFIDALNYLIEKYNIDVSNYTKTNFSSEKYRDKKVINQINEIAAIEFYRTLKETEDVQILEYLNKRKLTKENQIQFAIGYGNCKESLINILQAKGFSMEDIIKSELVKEQRKDDKIWYYETFKDRIIFPILDTNNKVVAFGGRTIGMVTSKNPKYINSTENQLYHKSEILYGLNIAIRKPLKNLILTEGFMDCIALQKVGITNVAASLGTALTEQQVKLIKKYTNEVIMCYDQDEPGKNATDKAINLLEKNDISCKILSFEGAKDPDEFINKYGVEKFKERVANVLTRIDFKINEMLKKEENNNEYDKINILKKVVEFISLEKSEISRDVYIEKYAKKFGITESAFKNEINKKTVPVFKTEKTELNYAAINRIKNVNKKLEQYLICLLLLNDSKLFDRISKNILPEYINDSIIRELYIKMLNEFKETKEIKVASFMMKLDRNEMAELTEIMLLDTSQYQKSVLVEDVEKKILFSNFEKTKNELLEKIKNPTITKDEKEILGIQIGLVLKRISEFK